MTTNQDVAESIDHPVDVRRVCASMYAPWDARNDQLTELLRISAEYPAKIELEVRQLLEQGININARDENKCRAVQLAKHFQAPMRIRDMLAYASREGSAQPENPPPPATAAEGHGLDIEFRGSAKEYFRIWAVNLCLTLLTLGIFSAWAKVRKKRYFYSQTLLDNSPFQYLGQPLPILKGRLVAVALFLLWYLSSYFFVTLMPAVIILAFILAPWVLVRSAAFNARYSAFRNMRFNFNGTYWDAVGTLYVWGLIPLILVGGFIMWLWQKPYLLIIAGFVFAFYAPFWIARVKRFLVGHTRFGGARGELKITGGDFYFIYLKTIPLGIAVAIITGGASFAIMKSMHLGPGNVIALLATLPSYLGYVIVYSYIQARTGNLIWNNTRLGALRFQSKLGARRLAGLYTSNGVAIVLSLGLLIPWAVVRSFHYRAQCLRGQMQGEWSDFSGSEASAVGAAGAEVSEIFDLDFSL